MNVRYLRRKPLTVLMLALIALSTCSVDIAQASISESRAKANALDWGLHKAACYGVYWKCHVSSVNCNDLHNSHNWRRAAYYCHVYIIRNHSRGLVTFLFGGGWQGCAGAIALSPIGVRFSWIFKCKNGSTISSDQR